MFGLEIDAALDDIVFADQVDAMAPGPELVELLAAVDVRSLSGYGRVAVLRARQRLVSHFMARLFDDMAAVYELYREEFDPVEAGKAASTEVRAALVQTRWAAELDMELAVELCHRYPGLMEALRKGRLDLRRVKVILAAVGVLADDEAGLVVDRVLAEAGSLTTGQLGALVRRLCLEVDPEVALERYEASVARRRVVIEATPEGTANLMGLELPAGRAAAVARRVAHIAQSLKRDWEQRTIDQLRADVFLDLLEGRHVAAASPGVGVTLRVDLETLAGLTDTAGELEGLGPVAAEVAPRIAAGRGPSRWPYTAVGRDGTVHGGPVRRRPTASVRRDVQAVYETCVFPGCRMPATDCDLDHRIPFAEGGPTDPDHLAPACRHDHVTVRHRIGWTYLPQPDGDHTWTSPLGRIYNVPRRPP